MRKKILILLASVAVFSLDTVAVAQKVPVLKFGEPLPANAFVELAKAVNPAVVNISTTMLVRPRARDPMFDMLERFYGMPMPKPQDQKALGTGFIIREDGLIVTNNHVIAGADKISVQLSEKEKFYDAKVIGSDERTDIALIKIVGKSFPSVQMGSSKDTEVGEWVAAFGNPLGNGHTMTKGIISAKGRSIGEINKFPLLQTDTPINPGNSGGPLVNMKGQVIGVNSAIVAGAQGLGFAIPIDEVKAIIPVLEKHGKIRKGYVGVVLGMVDPQQAAALGMKNSEGAVVADVEKTGPAWKAGLRPYDVVLDINGKKITNNQEMVDAVQDSAIGGTVPIKILRDGKPITLTMAIAEKTDGVRSRSRNPMKINGQKAPFNFGLSVADASKDLKEEFDIDPKIEKPVIVEIEPGSLADSSGFAPGDIIFDVNRVDVSTTKEAFKNLRKGTNTFRIGRQGAIVFFRVDVP